MDGVPACTAVHRVPFSPCPWMHSCAFDGHEGRPWMHSCAWNGHGGPVWGPFMAIVCTVTSGNVTPCTGSNPGRLDRRVHRRARTSPYAQARIPARTWGADVRRLEPAGSVRARSRTCGGSPCAVPNPRSQSGYSPESASVGPCTVPAHGRSGMERRMLHWSEPGESAHARSGIFRQSVRGPALTV